MNGSAKQIAAAVLLSGLIVGHAAAGDATAGAKVAAERCVSCHSSTDLLHSVVPRLEGQPKAYFLSQWRAFRERKRTAPAMVSLAAELSEKEVNDLAEHYSALSPPRALDVPGSETGRALAGRQRCADCHGSTLQGTEAGVARLAGQRAKYIVWSLQLMRSGQRSHGTTLKPDPALADLSNSEIEALAAYFESLR